MSQPQPRMESLTQRKLEFERHLSAVWKQLDVTQTPSAWELEMFVGLLQKTLKRASPAVQTLVWWAIAYHVIDACGTPEESIDDQCVPLDGRGI